MLAFASRPIATTWLLLCLAAPALAHTTVEAQASEGLRADNALRIGHGCAEQPVIAQSVVFPTDAPVIQVSEPGVRIADLGEVITQGSLAGLVSVIQDRNAFELQGEILDPHGKVVGFYARDGRREVEHRGRVPFTFSAPSFVAKSCAKRLLIRLAVADICKLEPAVRPDTVSLWIPDNGSALASQARAQGMEGVGEPATLIVNRNLAANPLGAACHGVKYDVTVTPSAAQVDRDLAILDYWKPR